jgi:hypothetical protein
LKFNIKEKIERINPVKKNADGKRAFFKKRGDGDEGNKFFDKVGDYFNPEPQKERVLRHEDFNAAGDVYYASVSAFYKVGERLLWLILAIFLVFSIITNYKEITFDNFFYLLKDFSSAADSEVPQYQVLSYDSDSRQTFALYRGGLVSASPSAVSVFTAGGRRTLKSNNEYYSPNIVCCDKYVLVYDSAGSAFSIYNSFSQVYTEQLDSPITDAAFAPDGSFAITTKNDDGKSVIRFYGKNLKYRGNVSDSMYVMDIALNENSDRFCKVSYQAGTGQGLSTLTLYDIASKQTASKLGTVEVSGEFPIGCSFIDNNKILLLTNLSVRVYDKNCREVEKYTFYGENIRAFSIGEEGASLVIGSETQKTVIVFDEKGEMVYNASVAENVSAVSKEGNFLFMRTTSGVTRVDLKRKTSEFLASESGKMLIYSEDTAMVCGDARAEYLVFGKKQ